MRSNRGNPCDYTAGPFLLAKEAGFGHHSHKGVKFGDINFLCFSAAIPFSKLKLTALLLDARLSRGGASYQCQMSNCFGRLVVDCVLIVRSLISSQSQ